MSLLALRFFSVSDLWLVPICLVLMYFIVRNRANNCKDLNIRPYYYRAFYFKVVCVFIYAFITEFYFAGGDTGLYYQGIINLRAAISDDSNNFWEVLKTPFITNDSPLAPYFLYDNYAFDTTINYMRAAANFSVPRLGIIPSLLFFNNYICIALFFALFALGGAIRIFKTFYYYYPAAKRELALGALFLPSVGFWSAGLLKDSVCFGCVGFALYGVFQLVFRRKKVLSSAAWIAVSGVILYTIKTYIFLVLLLAMVIWIFGETNKLIKEKALRQAFAVATFTVSITAGYFLLRYLTSVETLQQYQFENIVLAAENQRSNYAVIDQQTQGQSSYYNINTTNPVLLVLNSIGATFFRPFPWEVKSAAALLSTAEALVFLVLTLNLFFSIGIFKPFRLIFKEPVVMMSFLFAIVFSIGVGTSTANFGALSRYKIPCMPFYMITILIVYRYAKLPYPKWFSKILGYK